MRHFNRILLVVAVCYLTFAAFAIYYVIFGVSPFYGGRWKMVWNDEFSGAALDLWKWTAVSQGTDILKEIQSYKDDNVTVENGCLMITSKKEDWTGPDILHPGRLASRHYTSGHINTKNIESWTYGRFEIRARIPTAYGFRPYVSLISTESWPPEIAIIGGSGDRKQGAVFMDHYWLDNSLQTQVESSKPIFGQDYASRFHTYTVEWEPHWIRWYIDGIKKYQTYRGIPEENLYLDIKTSIGGEHPGDPWQKAYNQKPDVKPQYLMIDWIRVYQRK